MSKSTMIRQARTGDGVPGYSRTEPERQTRPLKLHAEVKPTNEQVSKRAYEIYAARVAKGEEGTEASDWAKAEAELNSAR
jgi:hypothetical protein